MVTIDNSSKPASLCFGILQSSVLGPVLFILYTKPLSNLIIRLSISSQSFAHDTQLLDSCHPDHLGTTVQCMKNCISEVNLRIGNECNKLKLINEKNYSVLIKSDRIKCSLILHPLLFELVIHTFQLQLMLEILESQSHPTQPWTSMSQTSTDQPTLNFDA